ncbi:pyridoxamine 5'-phosphate oxidase family protein [Hymenobacter lapidiphilus]|uniref:Pyridoxamine 5'-phosphate oxidase family protein n=1 Tax=Hymenobacter lapidiphilus TaxID=2608003 RepID=A0A7Y7U881_9BACT|nr:pyridoxamine 5'-phosphate oxidase family protein [Hymenobacter lapidiphilus]NVO33285.1 pyridoxamine 5'-phosphate oxidase family protein [Hymenobacter lapidiphilus]
MSKPTNVTHDLSILLDKIKEVRIAMLTTQDNDGSLRSRPMYTQKPDGSSALVFLTDKDSAKVYEVKKDSHVNLSYGQPDDNIYVSVSGRANAYRDQAEINKLWSEPMRAWFPKGKEDESIYILKVEIDKGEYWDTPSSLITQAYAYVRALATGERSTSDDVNEHAKVEVK